MAPTGGTVERLHGKFYVARVDERDAPGGDKAAARYFVLDYVHDHHARVALAAYAESVHREEYDLACDLRGELIDTEQSGRHA